MRKIDREYCLSDDTVNVYGYRLLTRGLKLDRYNPPIGYLMHDRGKGVAVRWEDLTVRKGALYGKPVINDTLYPDLAQQIEEGFYMGASVGHIVALKMTEDSEYKLEGQTGPTVLEWFPREVSIVDIPGNYDAIARLYAEDGGILMDLSDNADYHNPNNDNKMSYLQLTADDYAVLNLAANSTGDKLTATLRVLVAKAQRADALVKELDDLKADISKERIDLLLNQALADKKLYPAVADQLRKAYAGKPDDLKALIDTMPSQVSVTDIVKDEHVPADLAAKSYDDLWLSGQLEMVAQKYPNYYNTLKNHNNGTD